MTNDTNTLDGALMELGETMADNLTAQGVTASASDGLTTLAGKVLDISGGGGTITLTSNKTEVIAYNNETCTITANYSEGTGATIGLYINGTKIGNMTDNLDGTYSYTYTATGKGDLSINAKISNTISNTILLTDYLRKGLTNNDTWHQINNTNSMTVTDGVATGFNKLMDYNWDNTKDWEFSCKYKVNSANANGLIFADVTNTSNFDNNTFVILQNPNANALAITGHTGSTIWAGVPTNVDSREYSEIRVINKEGLLLFYINDVLYTAHMNISDITFICVGMYSWQSGTGSFKDVMIKYISDTDCPALEEVIGDAIIYINGTGGA